MCMDDTWHLMISQHSLPVTKGEEYSRLVVHTTLTNHCLLSNVGAKVIGYGRE